jgi:hypothetical protein
VNTSSRISVNVTVPYGHANMSTSVSKCCQVLASVSKCCQVLASVSKCRVHLCQFLHTHGERPPCSIGTHIELDLGVCHKGVIKVLQECHKSITKNSQTFLKRCYKRVANVSQRCYKSVTSLPVVSTNSWHSLWCKKSLSARLSQLRKHAPSFTYSTTPGEARA